MWNMNNNNNSEITKILNKETCNFTADFVEKFQWHKRVYLSQTILCDVPPIKIA